MTMSQPATQDLSEEFFATLKRLAEPGGAAGDGWWRDALAHPDLLIAVRRRSLNVYYRGASIFQVVDNDGQPVPNTHFKYLVRQRQDYVSLKAGGAFGLKPEDFLQQRYESPETLKEMISAAQAYAGLEKTGLHYVIQNSPNVIDVEIALAGKVPGDEDLVETDTSDAGMAPGGSKKVAGSKQQRIDAATLEGRGDPNKAWLVFYEAKHYANAALRAAKDKVPEVVGQMDGYRKTVATHSDPLKEKYRSVCQALARIDAMRREDRDGHSAWKGKEHRKLDELVHAVADGSRTLEIDPDPRLIVFGFDAAQKKSWEEQKEALKQAAEHTGFKLQVCALGDPRQLVLPTGPGTA